MDNTTESVKGDPDSDSDFDPEAEKPQQVGGGDGMHSITLGAVQGKQMSAVVF